MSGGDDGKFPFPQAPLLCHPKGVGELGPLIAVAAVVVAAALLTALAIALGRRNARIARLEAEIGALSRQLDQLALLERREAVCSPLDAVRLCWARCAPPDEQALHEAAMAAESAKRLFPAHLEPDLDEVARLLFGLARHRARQRDAVLAGRHGERVALMEEEAEMENVLKPKLAALNMLLTEAARPFGASGDRGL